MFKNLRIALKLGLGFGLVIVLAIVAQLVSFNATSSLFEIADDITENAYPKVQVASDLANGLDDMRITSRELILKTDPKDIAELESKQDQIIKDTEENIKKLKPLLNERAEEVIYKDIVEGWSVYLPVAKEIRALASSNKNDEATALMFGRAAPIIKKYSDALDAMVKFQEQGFTDSSKQADAFYERSKSMAMGMLALLMVGSAAIVFVLVRAITRPLAQSVAAANAIAAGDLSTRIDVTSSDETGQLLAAMQ
ncbi:MCP four helix bundle domain-containing protein, partial [Hydrogenophaga soli]